MSQIEKGRAFRALHGRAGAFVIPNPWDAGTARMLAQLGFEALATTSAGYAFAWGGGTTRFERDSCWRTWRRLRAATELPVSADLENGFGDSPEEVGGRSDGGGARDGGRDRWRTRSHERTDRSTIWVWRWSEWRRRWKQRGGLPFLYADGAGGELSGTGGPTLGYDRAAGGVSGGGRGCAVRAGAADGGGDSGGGAGVDRPVNVLAGGGTLFSVATWRAGVKRISVGSALARAALGAFLRAAREIRDRGTLSLRAAR